MELTDLADERRNASRAAGSLKENRTGDGKDVDGYCLLNNVDNGSTLTHGVAGR